MIRNWAQTTFEALSNRHYRILWLGTTLSFLAFGMQFVVQGVVAFDITGKNGAVGFVGLGMGVATIFASPFGGVIADRFSKRMLLLVGQSLIAISFAATGVLIIGDWITIPLLAASTFTLGLVFSFIAPARQAWVGELLEGPKLANGVALQQVSMTATRIAGPWIAVALVAAPFIGSGGAYIFMGLLLLLVVATLARMPQSRPSTRRASALGDMKAGISHVASRPRLGLLSLSFILVVMMGFSYQVLLPGFLSNELGRGSKDMGWMLGVAGASGLIGTVAVANRAGSKNAWWFLLAGAGALAAGLAALALAGTFLQALLVMVLIGAGSSVFQMLNSSLVMRESDPAYYGRVMSLTMLAWGFNSIAGVPFGFLADGIGERATLVIMGALVAAVTVGTAVAWQALAARGTRVATAAAVGADTGAAGGG